MTIAYHCSHEQFSPSQLLQYAIHAEQAGFDAIHSSDHFHPWSVRQGNSGFSFSWIAAAMQATSLPYSMVCAPGQRYHPAIVAQAIATIAELFPNRFSIELGSGEAINEAITGELWPDKQKRNERLLQCADVIRKLLNGEEVNAEGHIRVHEAKLYTLPTVIPPLFCAGVSPETIAWAAGWCDGILTTADNADDAKAKKEKFVSSGGENKPFCVQFSFSYAHNREEAITGAYDQWRSNLLSQEDLQNLSKPEQFDEKTATITLEEIKEKINIISSIDELQDIIESFRGIGINKLSLHNINRNQELFLSDFRHIK